MRLSKICCGLTVLLSFGCSKSNQPQTEATPAAAPSSMADEATSKLKVALDSWAFGDSIEKFKQDHPDISFHDVEDVLRRSVLLRYEITNQRPKEFVSDSGTHQGFECSVVLVFAGKNGQEIKESRIYGVRKADDEWLVFGNSP